VKRVETSLERPLRNEAPRLVIGAPNNGCGYIGHMKVYQCNFGSGQWPIMELDLDRFAAGGQAGFSVTISGDGSRVAMGTPST
jgi:hypothetical protein